MLRRLALFVLMSATPLSAASLPSASVSADPPLVIGHRGASGLAPEHTLAAYQLAILQGADFIEPDLVMTKDGVLVARHENEISGTTDVATHREFAARRTTKTIDGVPVTGWFTEDFTLDELKTLRARERLPQLRPDNAQQDGTSTIATFQEILDLVAATRDRRVGIYPEIKHGSYFARIGLGMERPLLAVLTRAGYTGANDPVFIQSFEVGALRTLRGLTRLRLVQLIDADGAPADQPATLYRTMVTPAGLSQVARYADAVGVTKALIVPRDATGRSLSPTRLVTDAHAAGLKVHVWTFRAENAFLPLELRRGEGPITHGDLSGELRQFYALGVDAVFSDFPGVAVAARSARIDGHRSARADASPAGN